MTLAIQALIWAGFIWLVSRQDTPPPKQHRGLYEVWYDSDDCLWCVAEPEGGRLWFVSRADAESYLDMYAGDGVIVRATV